ncbi:lytic transglycosylase domain-containing protein [Nocardia goodfellowii]
MPVIQLVGAAHSANPLRDWAIRRAVRLGIPERALRAYGYATIVLAKTQPGCHLGWTTLAGIARIESDHGRFRGATIATDGSVRPPIRGIALDGTNGTAQILDPEATARAGRTVYAKAAGPFQFIPDTWKRWGVRANTDAAKLMKALASGKPEHTRGLPGSPDNIDDAALAAGRYLCASGGDLATYSGWSKAIFAYNHSTVYVSQVHSAASGYTKHKI